MELIQLDAAIRIAAIMTILLLAWFLLRHPQRVGMAAALFAPLAICLTGFIIGNTAEPSLRPTGIVGIVAHLVSGYTVIFLWWFCLSCFDNHFKL